MNQFGQVEMDTVRAALKRMWKTSLAIRLTGTDFDEALSRVLEKIVVHSAREPILNYTAYTISVAPGIMLRMLSERSKRANIGAVTEGEIAQNEERDQVKKAIERAAAGANSTDDIARIAGVSPRTVRRHGHAGSHGGARVGAGRKKVA